MRVLLTAHSKKLSHHPIDLTFVVMRATDRFPKHTQDLSGLDLNAIVRERQLAGDDIRLLRVAKYLELCASDGNSLGYYYEMLSTLCDPDFKDRLEFKLTFSDGREDEYFDDVDDYDDIEDIEQWHI